MLFGYCQVYRTRACEVTLAGAARTSVFATSRKYSIPTDAPIRDKSKLWRSADEAVKDVKSRDVLLCGG